MNACPSSEQLRQLLAEQLSDADRDGVEAHVEGCPACQATLEELTGALTPGGRRPEGEAEGCSRPEPDSGFLRRLGRRSPKAPAAHGRKGGEDTAPSPGPAATLTAAECWPEVPGYEILGVLGKGGMGVVYRAYDCRRREVVALKVMRSFDAPALYRFKQEFRSLADLGHPNLVPLYDLVGDGGQWFFTMALVAGADFLAHVRGGAGPRDQQPTAPASPATLPLAEAERVAAGPAERPLAPEQLARLRPALAQLARGVAFLHQAGKLHRDIKPTNVLVTPEGRVVLLDFGLVVELNRSGWQANAEQEVAGTVGYMAPEQAAGRPLTAASDWYSVGAMLYEGLTGRLPFTGPTAQVLWDKQRADPEPPAALVAGLPADLAALCTDLLRRDARSRPSGSEVLRRLAASDDSLPPPPAAGRVPLVGRAPHLAALADANACVRPGRPVVVHVHGRPGVGKSALVRHFLDGLAGRALVLAGRCYEQESVPYKALDGLVDALSHHLRALPPDDAEALLPGDLGALVRVFPVLRQAEGRARPLRPEPETPNRQEVRRRAFAALRELLARLGRRGPLVLAIDDLQWGDVDSAALLTEVLRPPDAPALLLLACYRSDDAATSPCLQALGPATAGGGALVDRRELTVGPLAPEEARELALALLDPQDPSAGDRAEAIARESGGNPLFTCELAHSARTTPAAGLPSLEEVLWARVRHLPGEARRLLEVVAVAGTPLRQDEACAAAELAAAQRGALAVLHSARLLRSTGLGDADAVEAYHDRIRETVVARLDPDALRGHHGRLARLLEESGRAEPELLAVHFYGAGEAARAGHYYGLAADRAAGALAFDRAAQLYRRALELHTADAAQERRLRTCLGDALANAGRGGESARAYLAAAGAGAPEALELRRRAALQFLLSGHVDEGLAALRTVLAAVGLKLAPTPRRALLFLLMYRAKLWFRGLRFQEHDAGQVSPEDIRRLDIYWSVAMGLGIVDPIRGADYQTRNLLLALRAGEPYRIARALALEAGFVATAGRTTTRRTSDLLTTAGALARQVGNPHALGLVSLANGLVAYLEGRWKDTLAPFERAESIFRDSCIGVAWELDTAQVFYLGSLTYRGELAALSRRLPLIRKEAVERGDLYALTWLDLFLTPVARMAADGADEAGRELRQQRKRLSRQGFHVQHANALYREGEVELYRGDGNAARQRAAELWPALAGSLLHRIQHMRMCTCHLRARSALAAAMAGSDPGLLLTAAERDARRLEGEKRADARGWARLVRAGIAAAAGTPARAAALLAEAAADLDMAGMGHYAAAARRRLGEVVGGEQGRALVAAADSWMRDQNIRNPARMTAMLAPGFPDRGTG
jgi:serine/threonine protein kinase